jgi:hypothetical protein
VEDNLRAGMSAAQARREAVLRFGGVESAKEGVRSGWTVGFLGSLARICSTRCAVYARIQRSR